MICFGLVVVMWCEVQTPPSPVDSYCLVYQQIIQEKGDSLITGPPSVKKRILANELIYRKNCGGKK